MTTIQQQTDAIREAEIVLCQMRIVLCDLMANDDDCLAKMHQTNRDAHQTHLEWLIGQRPKTV